MPLILPGNVASATASTTYTVANSCRFDFGSSPKLTRAVSTGAANTKFTFSCWFKTSTLNSSYARFLWGGVDSGNETGITLYATSHGSSGAINLYLYGSSSIRSWLTNASHRDPSAWYHMVVRVDTTDATAGDRIQLWVNGTRVTSWSASSNPDENETFDFFHSNNLTIGREQDSGDRFSFDGYLAEVCVIDGTAYTASDFGEFSSDSPTIWVPKDPSGLTFGTSGFYLDFEDSADLGADVSGNSNDLTVTNLDATDQATDTPTNNFATGNPIIHGGKLPTLSEGNCKYVADSAWYHVPSTFGVSSGKWYAEFKIVALTGGQMMGVIDSYEFSAWGASPPEYVGAATLGMAYQNNGDKHSAGSSPTYGDTYTTGDIIGAALNADDGEITFYKNGAVQDSGTAITLPTSANSTGIWFFLPSLEDGTVAANYGGCSAFTVSSGNADANGYGNFEYAVPDSYFSLCSKNLAEYG